MFPVFVLFGKEIYIYPTMATIGILIAGFYMCYMARRAGMDENDAIVALLLASIGMLAGAHILYALTNLEYIGKIIHNLNQVTSLEQGWKLVVSVFGGAVFYGGMYGLLAGLWIFFRKSKKTTLKPREFWPIVALGIPLFHGFGRIGCFLGGCCYGVPMEGGVTYHHALVAEANGVARFPIQLVESGLNFGLAFVLYRLYQKEPMRKHLLPIYLATYGVIRFTDEFFRGDTFRGIYGGISTSQIIALLSIVGVGAYYLLKKIKMEDFK